MGPASRRHGQEGRLASTFRRLLQNRGATIGLAVLSFLVVIAVLAPQLAPYDPVDMVPDDRFLLPSGAHPLGTDQFGRDLLSRIMHGARISLTVGLISVGIAAVIGVVLGLLAGYYSGWLDAVIMRSIDVMMAFPGILLALVIVAVLGAGITNVMIAVGISSVPTYARLTRGCVLSAKEFLYVDAARTLGCRDRRILFRHILPNVLAPLIVVSTLGVAGAILSSAALSFLGLGAQPPSPEWGAMLSGGRAYLRDSWWIATFPGLAIMLAVLSINMLGDGLRDALDPRMKV
ncbi:MAG: ABC transporter permease [Chloroflexi bacterium]|nr:ABC transporter permease [Chloroflexota bacterium]MCL5108678.1 ABC transporter permease [Chloroflexota bacterium]